MSERFVKMVKREADHFFFYNFYIMIEKKKVLIQLYDIIQSWVLNQNSFGNKDFILPATDQIFHVHQLKISVVM